MSKRLKKSSYWIGSIGIKTLMKHTYTKQKSKSFGRGNELLNMKQEIIKILKDLIVKKVKEFSDLTWRGFRCFRL